MDAPIRTFGLLICAAAVPALAQAQESVAGNAIAEQLAASSLRMVGSMLAVLALVAVCAWAVRRWRDRYSSDTGSIEIVSGISLGSKERIVLLRVGSEQVLVGVSPAGMRSLHVVKEAPPERRAEDKTEAEVAALPTQKLPREFSLSMGAAQ